MYSLEQEGFKYFIPREQTDASLQEVSKEEITPLLKSVHWNRWNVILEENYHQIKS